MIAAAARPHPPSGSFARLLRYERQLGWNHLFAAASTWRERIRWLIGIPTVLIVMHFWFADLPPQRAANTASGMAFFFTFALTRSTSRRLAFHREEGLMAPDALHGGVGPAYFVLAMVAGLLGLLFAIVLLTSTVPLACIVAMSMGLAMGALFNAGRRIPKLRRLVVVTVRSGSLWVRRPLVGLLVAVVYGGLVALIAGAIPESAALPALASLGFACCFVLSPIDAKLVRFMAQNGYTPWPMFVAHLRGLAMFIPIAAVLAGLAAGTGATVLFLVVAASATVIACLRLLAYRIYDKWAADWIVTGTSALLGMTAAFVLPALPFALAAVLWQLWRRARVTTWLLTA